MIQIKHLVTFLLLVFSSGPVFGVITIAIELEELLDASSQPTDALVIVVVDTASDGFGDLIPGGVNVGDFLSDGNDQILFRAQTLIPGLVTAFQSGIDFGDFAPAFGFNLVIPVACYGVADFLKHHRARSARSTRSKDVSGGTAPPGTFLSTSKIA